MSKNIVFEGWLTKSPPLKRIWRTKWRRRWFALRHSGELPGQYFLDYYADRNCRRLKGTINLDFCEQVDAGLHMERGSNCTIDPKLRGSVFTIQTQSRVYHLEADCEADMERWVDAICKVCGLRATEETQSSTTGVYQNHAVTITRQENVSRVTSSTRDRRSAIADGTIVTNDHYECAESTGPYIPISECFTGPQVKPQDAQRAFTFDPKDIITTTQTFDGRPRLIKPQIMINNVEISDNESNNSEDECRSLDPSHHAGDVTKKNLVKNVLPLPPRRDKEKEIAPPVPPRPPKTFALSKETPKESFQGPKIQEPVDVHGTSPFPWIRVPRRPSTSQGTTPTSPGPSATHSLLRTTDDEDETNVGHSIQYCNLSNNPPAVDRALKPRPSSHSTGNVNAMLSNAQFSYCEESKRDVLQYLDLDLQTSKPSPSNSQESSQKPGTIIHGKTSKEEDSAYKTVDFLKTEAFNITRQDAEASRSNQQ